jgi:hypothetical protein
MRITPAIIGGALVPVGAAIALYFQESYDTCQSAAGQIGQVLVPAAASQCAAVSFARAIGIILTLIGVVVLLIGLVIPAAASGKSRRGPPCVRCGLSYEAYLANGGLCPCQADGEHEPDGRMPGG